MKNSKTIAIIGLGYVGLPLAVEFGKIQPVIGFDINTKRIKDLSNGIDETLECTADEIFSAKKLKFSHREADLQKADIYIVTVPTPVDNANRPDMLPLVNASKTVGGALKFGDIVIYESTVYPGATEEVCVPILEKFSKLKFNVDFYCGYSPERINPGDKLHRLTNIVKITSGSTEKVSEEIDKLYGTIITAGTHKAKSIKIAEAAKVIENTQRDLNIALMNELSIIFKKLQIDTLEVLKAAGTKWNFLPFRPGLVGGHCIGVDPYYLTYKAQQLGYHPEVILAGRRINDNMSKYIVDMTIKEMINKRITIHGSNLLVLGLAFKENCPDLRNSKVVDLVKNYIEYGINVDIYDPWVDIEEAYSEYGLKCLDLFPHEVKYDAIIVAVAHTKFVELGQLAIKKLGNKNSILFDVKGIYSIDSSDIRL